MMGRVGKDGFLKLHRGDKLKQQDCPHTGESRLWCGDWCPQFGEPCNSFAGGTRLEICQGRVLYFEEGNFVDERKKEEESK
ncbi:MAG TPA: hypothetical protein DCZ95_14095 [Verrucomicrobia bacterium]|nr:hypothetical protein [Verrucomicrobiota bacterium]